MEGNGFDFTPVAQAAEEPLRCPFASWTFPTEAASVELVVAKRSVVQAAASRLKVMFGAESLFNGSCAGRVVVLWSGLRGSRVAGRLLFRLPPITASGPLGPVGGGVFQLYLVCDASRDAGRRGVRAAQSSKMVPCWCAVFFFGIENVLAYSGRGPILGAGGTFAGLVPEFRLMVASAQRPGHQR